jgi:hypothetical protein
MIYNIDKRYCMKKIVGLLIILFSFSSCSPYCIKDIFTTIKNNSNYDVKINIDGYNIDSVKNTKIANINLGKINLHSQLFFTIQKGTDNISDNIIMNIETDNIEITIINNPFINNDMPINFIIKYI